MNGWTDDEVIAEFRRRLIAGRYGDRTLLLSAEQNYSGMWSALMAQLSGWETRFGIHDPVIHEIRTTVHRLADQRPNAVKVFALATTRYGQEDDVRVVT